MQTIARPVSYRHRRLVQDYEYQRHIRKDRVAMEFEAEKVELPKQRLDHQEAVELIMSYTRERDRVVRSALTLMAQELSSVYGFIDMILSEEVTPGSRARSKQIAIEDLADHMSQEVFELLRDSPGIFQDASAFADEPPF